MRIAVVSDSVFPTPDRRGGHGLGFMVSQIAELLLLRGHDVTLFALPGSSFSGKLVTPERAAERSSHPYGGENALAAHVWREHRRNPFDAILDNSHLHALSRVQRDAPVVNVYHDIYQEYRHCPVLLSFGQKALMPQPFAHAPVVHNALRPEPFHFSTEPKNYVLFIGALSELKNPLLAIEACARANVPLVVAGYEVYGKFPVSGREGFQYVGRVDPDARLEWIKNARVLLQLSEVESFGLTTLEATMFGTPVVAMPSGGSVDIIEHGVNGWFVPAYGNNLTGPVADAIRAAWLLDRARVRTSTINRFSVEKQISQYESLLSLRARGGTWE